MRWDGRREDKVLTKSENRHDCSFPIIEEFRDMWNLVRREVQKMTEKA